MTQTRADIRGQRVRLALRLAVAIVGAVVVGCAALVATAAATARPELFLLVGFVTFTLATAGFVALATRGVATARRSRVRAVAIGSVLVVGSTFFVVTSLLPLGDPRTPATHVAGQRTWDLPTGSRIAYVRLPAAPGTRQRPPVVFVPGGPGVPDMHDDARFFGQLTRDGFDVYIYDGLGSGRSSRLSDPSGYTLQRDVADLAAIQEQIGAPRVILIGHSYGAQVAAGYLAAHPERVARAVFSSPGALDPGDGSGAGLTGRLNFAQKLRTYALTARPRALLGYALLQVNPRAAHAFAGDAEMDARFDRIYNRTRPALHCRGAAAGPELHGLGMYRSSVSQSASAPAVPDLRPALKGTTTPAIILKGSCDYLSWPSAWDYRRALPRSRLVYLEDAGHNAYQDQPTRYLTALRAFLLGRSLGTPAWDSPQAPESFEGPRG